MTDTATGQRGRVRVERSAKRIRAYLGGDLVVDTTSPALVWERPYAPTYYLPIADLRADLVPGGPGEHSPSRGEGTTYDVVLPRRTAAGAATVFHDSPIEELRQLVRLRWDAMDEWLEEDEPVYVHPRNPYHRVDVLASSRHVRVEIDGVTVADSHRPTALFETGLPTRWYLPMTDVRLDLLTPTDTQTQCPYKGTASYWTVDTGHGVHPDIVWGYRTPLPESQKIAGMLCFYNEKVDLYVDGVRQDRPHTPFS